ncbi:MAG: WYL domain-containing protein [Verrucomicrobiales bacterium]|nr:WYL domain-containing protein [Verrucomicrobiales bacterium]
MSNLRSNGRTLHPCQLVCATHRWYVLGHGTARRALRAFVVGRIREPEVQNERFARPRTFRVEDYLKGSFGIFKGRGDFEVVIDLDRWAADLVRGRKWHASQVTKDLPGGELRIGFRLSSIEAIEPWVLGWGAHATVVRPKALVDRVRTAAAGMVKGYAAVRGADVMQDLVRPISQVGPDWLQVGWCAGNREIKSDYPNVYPCPACRCRRRQDRTALQPAGPGRIHQPGSPSGKSRRRWRC